jgi:hypothetical protein
MKNFEHSAGYELVVIIMNKLKYQIHEWEIERVSFGNQK